MVLRAASGALAAMISNPVFNSRVDSSFLPVMMNLFSSAAILSR